MTALRQFGGVGEAGVTRVRAALRWEPRSDALWRALLSTPLLAVSLLLLTWPVIVTSPLSGPDASWQAGLYMALDGGLQFGRDVVFTYGPLGFLHAPNLYGEGLFVVAMGYAMIARLLLIASLLWTARRALPLPLALGVCFVVLAVGHLNSAMPMVAFLWSFAALRSDAPQFAPKLLVFGGGFVAALELLAKVNFGIAVLVICLLPLVVLPRRARNLTLFSGVFLCSLLGLWLLTGQAIGNLPSYLAGALQMVSGYPRAMGIDVGPRPGEITYALAAVSILVVGALLATRGERRALRWASIAVLLLFLFLCFKQDFIRRGAEGRADFSLMTACAALAIAARLPAGAVSSRAARNVGRRRSAAAAALLAPMLALVVWANPAPSLDAAIDPQTHAEFFREDMELLGSTGARARTRDASRAALRDGYAVAPAILSRIGDASVAIEPWEISAAWAYDLNWKPLPVIQDYAAYTPALDRMNIAALEGQGPEMILRRNLRGVEATSVEIVDGRYPAWDGPGAKLALLCNYREVLAGGEWQLLGRSPGRCGPSRSLGTIEATTGDPVSVPRPSHPTDEIVFARIDGLAPDLVEKAETLLYRAPNGWVSFDGGRRWNMESDTAGDGLILSAPAAVDYRRPFQLAPNPRSFRVGIDGAGARPITVSFYSRSVETQPTTVEPRRATVEPRRAGSLPRAAISG